MVLGHEGAGVVVAVGDGVNRYAVGDHVVSSFVSMCGRCHYCQTGRPHPPTTPGPAFRPAAEVR